MLLEFRPARSERKDVGVKRPHIGANLVAVIHELGAAGRLALQLAALIEQMTMRSDE